jgi:Zn finger protein HypA/HybF involved in hydrogenase expression
MSHDGCSGTFANGMMVADKVRQMGFDQQFMPMPFDMNCHNCKKVFEMEKFETHCPNCGMVYAVTPCHAFDPENVMAAGIGY